MKLLLCQQCGDVFNIRQKNIKSCSCGATKGVYVDIDHAQYAGEHAVPIGFNNRSLARAIVNGKPTATQGADFAAFLTSPEAPTYLKVSEL